MVDKGENFKEDKEKTINNKETSDNKEDNSQLLGNSLKWGASNRTFNKKINSLTEIFHNNNLVKFNNNNNNNNNQLSHNKQVRLK